MKVKELINKYELYVRYSADRHIVNKHEDAEVLAYVVATSEDGVKASAYLFRSSRLIIGIMDGMRRQPREVLSVIETMTVEQSRLKDEKVRKELFAAAL